MAVHRVYIAGAGGMLGQAVYSYLSTLPGLTIKATDIVLRLAAPWLTHCDVRVHPDLRQSILDFSPDLILNLAALTNLEECEARPHNAEMTNADAAEQMALLADKLGATLCYISTAGIVDGSLDYYTDDMMDVAAFHEPISVYGRTKLAGQIASTACARHYILRPGWMMGGGPTLDKKFINLLYRQLRSGARTVHAVTDKLGTPTYTHAFARQLWRIAQRGRYGSYNVVCQGSGSRYDVAREFVAALGLADQVRVVPVASDHFAATHPAPRPRSEQLLNTRLQSLGWDQMPHWKDALREYAEEFRKDWQQ